MAAAFSWPRGLPAAVSQTRNSPNPLPLESLRKTQPQKNLPSSPWWWLCSRKVAGKKRMHSSNQLPQEPSHFKENTPFPFPKMSDCLLPPAFRWTLKWRGCLPRLLVNLPTYISPWIVTVHNSTVLADLGCCLHIFFLIHIKMPNKELGILIIPLKLSYNLE